MTEELRPGLVRDKKPHCTTCGGTRLEHDSKSWPHTWLPRYYVRERPEPTGQGVVMSEEEHRGLHDFYREGKWQKCHGCDYLEPVGMISIPEDD